jgi:hypothetical protein
MRNSDSNFARKEKLKNEKLKNQVHQKEKIINEKLKNEVCIVRVSIARNETPPFPPPQY